MTATIDRETLPWTEEEFVARINAHVERLNEYYRHLVGVEQDKADDTLTEAERRVAFPPPSDHMLVEMAIGMIKEPFGSKTARADYVLIGPSLEVRKKRLCEQVDAAEREEIEKIMPSRKARHWQFREQDIHVADHMRLSNHPVRIEHDQVDAWLRSVRPTEETALLDEMKARRDTQTAIQRWAAKMHHDIDDLTEATVDAFEVTPFHG